MAVYGELAWKGLLTCRKTGYREFEWRGRSTQCAWNKPAWGMCTEEETTVET